MKHRREESSSKSAPNNTTENKAEKTTSVGFENTLKNTLNISFENTADEEPMPLELSALNDDRPVEKSAYHQVKASSEKTSTRRKRRKKKSRFSLKQKIAMAAGIPVAVILILVIIVFAYIGSVDKEMALAPEELTSLQQELAPPPTTPEEPYYILVLGSDARPGDTVSRSDTIMLCRMDPEKNRISILSIPRDTKVELEGYGTQKINAAMAFGGPAGATKAVSEFVGVDISHFVLIDFEGFTDIIDVLGGISIEVPYDTTLDGRSINAGRNILSSREALAFSRSRFEYALGDFQRAANQRNILKAVARDLSKRPINEIPGLVKQLASSLQTDLTTTKLVQIARDFHGINIDTDIHTGQVPSTTATIDGISYVLTVDDQWAEVREKFINGEVPFTSTDNQPTVID